MITRRFTNALRVLLLAAAIAVVSWHADTHAQNKPVRVGVLTPSTGGPMAQDIAILRRYLAERGWIEGKTISLVLRDAQGNPSQMQQGAADLVRQKVDVIYAYSAPALRAAFDATRSIPIVGTDYTNDPVAAGYAKSYARPGGNVTGVFLDAPGFAAKWLEQMREIIPHLERVAVLWDPSPGDTHVRALNAIAPSLGIKLQVVELRKPGDIEKLSFDVRPQAMVILPSPMAYLENARFANLATTQRIPAASVNPRFPDAGGLLAYGPENDWTAERAAVMVDKILRGAKPAELPIERPLKFELVINLKTAKALNLKVPETLLVRADRVIR
jgi:putative tryptophan/tyrosine transport system substrate-binding protein